MRWSLLVVIAGSWPIGCGEPSPADVTPPDAPYSVRQDTLSWVDFTRLLELPVRAYVPDGDDGPYPVVVFSPGVGTSRDHYASLGQYWASHGYLALFLTHPGADEQAIYGDHWAVAAIVQAVIDFAEHVTARTDHPRDVAFVLDQLEQSLRFKEVADLDRIAVAGHSFGALTALALIGMQVDTLDGPARQMRDPRIQAAIALSPPSPGVLGVADNAWDTLAAPCLTFSGTLDWDPVNTDPTKRRAAFERAAAPDQYLAWLRGGTHGVFDEQSPWPLDNAAFREHRTAIEQVTTAFLDAHLRRDARAQQWLLSREIETTTGGGCTLEYKRVTPLP